MKKVGLRLEAEMFWDLREVKRERRRRMVEEGLGESVCLGKEW
jgi:hypothetical protein